MPDFYKIPDSYCNGPCTTAAFLVNLSSIGNLHLCLVYEMSILILCCLKGYQNQIEEDFRKSYIDLFCFSMVIYFQFTRAQCKNISSFDGANFSLLPI